MEVLDSPNFAPQVQNYKQQRKLPPAVEVQTPLALVRSSSLASILAVTHITPSVICSANATSLGEGGFLVLPSVTKRSSSRAASTLCDHLIRFTSFSTFPSRGRLNGRSRTPAPYEFYGGFGISKHIFSLLTFGECQLKKNICYNISTTLQHICSLFHTKQPHCIILCLHLALLLRDKQKADASESCIGFLLSCYSVMGKLATALSSIPAV